MAPYGTEGDQLASFPQSLTENLFHYFSNF